MSGLYHRTFAAGNTQCVSYVLRSIQHAVCVSGALEMLLPEAVCPLGSKLISLSSVPAREHYRAADAVQRARPHSKRAMAREHVRGSGQRDQLVRFDRAEGRIRNLADCAALPAGGAVTDEDRCHAELAAIVACLSEIGCAPKKLLRRQAT